MFVWGIVTYTRNVGSLSVTETRYKRVSCCQQHRRISIYLLMTQRSSNFQVECSSSNWQGGIRFKGCFLLVKYPRRLLLFFVLLCYQSARFPENSTVLCFITGSRQFLLGRYSLIFPDILQQFFALCRVDLCRDFRKIIFPFLAPLKTSIPLGWDEAFQLHQKEGLLIVPFCLTQLVAIFFGILAVTVEFP